ncbi:MAG: TIGR01459 family HAD-type hydrolase, partial [Amylibacter sp.]
MALSKQDADWAFNAYEAVLSRLPQAQFPDCYETAETLSDIAAHFDTFLLDSFGVLNIGATAIPGAVERIDELRALGKRIIVVTNAAGYPKHVQIA